MTMEERYKVDLHDIGIPLFMLASLVFVFGGVFEFYSVGSVNATLFFFGIFYLFLCSAILLIRRI
jgi:uncharacterized membrane protein YGL010W